MERSECFMCRRQRAAFYCKNCTSDLLQQRRTMVSALQADVAVLRTKADNALSSRSALVQAERRLEDYMRRVKLLTDRLIKTREQLCSERIVVVEQTTAFEERLEQLELAQQKLVEHRRQADDLHVPVLECLELQTQYARDVAARARGEKIRELFTLFGLVSPENSSGDRFFRSITNLPLPISGRYDLVPVEVVAAALGKVIHLLLCLVKHLKITYIHPMIFNGSFSTIGNTSEGAGCHTLYPDGSVGFERGLSMLHENVAFVCSLQGIDAEKLSATDLLGNIVMLLDAPHLGRLCDDSDRDDPAQSNSQLKQSVIANSAFLLDASQTLDASVEILPHYS